MNSVISYISTNIQQRIILMLLEYEYMAKNLYIRYAYARISIWKFCMSFTGILQKYTQCRE